MNSLHLVEGGPAQEAIIPAAVATALRERKVVDLVSLGNDRYLASPGYQLGIANFGGFVVRIDAKLDITQLVFMIGFTRQVSWDITPVELAPHDNFVDAVAHAFVQQAAVAIRPGLLQGYHEIEDELAVGAVETSRRDRAEAGRPKLLARSPHRPLNSIGRRPHAHRSRPSHQREITAHPLVKPRIPTGELHSQPRLCDELRKFSLVKFTLTAQVCVRCW